MIFRSSEVRWFSIDRETLWDIYQNLAEKGAGVAEQETTHKYLRSNLINTGVKIDGDKYEIKIKALPDRNFGDHGMIEHWMKWSVEGNFLGSVKEDLLGDWITLEKKRYKKTYEIVDGSSMLYTNKENVEEGFAAEFTEIFIPAFKLKIYTFALDAFSVKQRSDDNLTVALKRLEIPYDVLNSLDTFGYPELLSRIKGQEFYK